MEQACFEGRDKPGYQGCIITVFVLMTLNLDLRAQMLLTLLSFGVVVAAYAPRSRFGSHTPSRAREVVE